MASPQLENGFSPVANELLDAILQIGFSKTEFHILFWVVRNTFGWHRKLTEFTWYQMAKDCRLSRGGVVTKGNGLVERMVLKIEAEKIGVQKDYEKWKKGEFQPFLGKPITSMSAHKRERKAITGVSGCDHKRERFSVGLNQYLNQENNTTFAPPPKPPPETDKKSKPLTDIQRIVLGWKILSGIPVEDKAWDKVHFARCSRSAKALIDLFGNHSEALNCMEFVFKELTAKSLTCTIETVVKHSDRYRKARDERAK